MKSCLNKRRILSVVGKTPWLLLFLSLGGWMLFVIGFGLTNHNPQLLDWLGSQFKGRTQNLFFSFWICCFVGGALYISLYLHLMFRRWYTSLLMHILTSIYLISSGSTIMTEFILNNLTLSFLQQTQPLWSYVQLEMSGCIISFLSLAVLMWVWPLLSVRPLPGFLVNLRSHSINQSHSHVPLVESATHEGGGAVDRQKSTGHKFAIANPSAAPPTDDIIPVVTTETKEERKALLSEKATPS